MVTVGVIGCGKIAQVRHLPEYASRENVVIKYVFDLCRERAEEVAKQYGAKAAESYQEILGDPEVDAVSVCAANSVHCQITVEALRAGKHVLCEKPMAVTLEECEQMVQTARETGNYLMIGHNQRLAKAHVWAKKLLEAGEIGKILTFRTSFGHGGPETWAIDSKNIWFFDKKQAFFGAMADLGIHKTDLIQFLTGEKVKAVTAWMGTLDKKDSLGNPISVDDNAICIYEFGEHITGVMAASWTYYGKEDNSTVLYGTEGVMHIYENPDYSIVIEKRGGEVIRYELDQIQTNTSQTKSGIIDMWIDSLEEGRQPEISGEEALSAMRAVFAAAESAKEGRRILV